MATKAHRASSAVAWLARRPGYMLLTASDEALAAEPPERFGLAWLELMALSTLLGVLLVNLWGVSWRIFRDYDPLIMPAAVTGCVFCLWPFRRGLAALTELLNRSDGPARSVVSATLVLAVVLCLARLDPDWQRREPLALPQWLDWLRPAAKLYRVLLLMPMWGGWGMIIAVKFCRPTGRTEPQVAAFARGCGAAGAAACMAGLLLMSICYFHHLGLGGQICIPLVTVLAAIAGGAGLCRLDGAPTRRALLAGNVVTQMAFVVAYLAAR